MQESNLPRRQYTDEFKIEAIRLAESIGGHEAARRLGVQWPRWATGREDEWPQDWRALQRRMSRLALQPCPHAAR